MYKSAKTQVLEAIRDQTKFGRLTPLRLVRKVGDTRYHVACNCECGTAEATVLLRNLIEGGTKSCGCLAAGLKSVVNSGDRYGILSIIKEVEKVGEYRMFETLCDCGGTTVIKLESLRSGNTKSCGCLVRTHGQRNTVTYTKWCSMIQRTTNLGRREAKHYMLRGITVCDEWLEFSKFYADMGDCPEGMSLDRADNNGNYCKENCRWATVTEQMNNRSISVRFTYKGLSLTLDELSKHACVPMSTLRSRLYRSKWSVEDACTLPLNSKAAKNIAAQRVKLYQ